VVEGRHRAFMGWLSPGLQKHFQLGIFVTSFFGTRPLPMTTTTNAASVPWCRWQLREGNAQDILPHPVAARTDVGDTEMAQSLAAWNWEEDLALCSYVCPGKYEYGPFCGTT